MTLCRRSLGQERCVGAWWRKMGKEPDPGEGREASHSWWGVPGALSHYQEAERVEDLYRKRLELTQVLTPLADIPASLSSAVLHDLRQSCEGQKETEKDLILSTRAPLPTYASGNSSLQTHYSCDFGEKIVIVAC